MVSTVLPEGPSDMASQQRLCTETLRWHRVSCRSRKLQGWRRLSQKQLKGKVWPGLSPKRTRQQKRNRKHENQGNADIANININNCELPWHVLLETHIHTVSCFCSCCSPHLMWCAQCLRPMSAWRVPLKPQDCAQAMTFRRKSFLLANF